jgi:hypothetical protein
MKSCWFHDWTKWTFFKTVDIVVSELSKIPLKTYRIQRRECNKCGLEQFIRNKF